MVLDAGSLPLDWRTSTIGAVAQVKGGKRLLKGEKFAETTTPFPYIRVTDLSRFGVDCADLRYLRPETQAAIKRYTISKDDVYISIAGSIGITGMIPASLDGANLTENAAKLVIDRHMVDARFLTYSLASGPVQTEIRAQTVKNAQPKLALARIASIKISLPPLAEQRKIASVLSLVQREVEQQEQLIGLTTELKKALMHKLFTEGLRGEPQKMTEIGPVPESWEVVPLEQVVSRKVVDGVHKTPTYISVGFPFITAKDIIENGVSFDECRYISAEEHAQLTRAVKAQPGDVLLTKVGTVGNVALVDFDEEFSFFVQIALIRPAYQIIMPEFLYWALQSGAVQLEILSRAPQSTMKFIGTQKIAKIMVPLPRMSEQIEIAGFLNIIRMKLRQHRRKLGHLQQLFRTLLHQLLTGQIRVNDLEPPRLESATED